MKIGERGVALRVRGVAVGERGVVGRRNQLAVTVSEPALCFRRRGRRSRNRGRL